jgi:hypothetical protein
MARKSANDKTFVRITNQDIFQKLELLIEQNNDSHSQIIQKQTATNGKVKLAFWVATSAATGIMVLAGFLFTHVNAHP